MCVTKFSNLFKNLQQILNNKMDQEERIKKMKVKDLKEELKSFMVLRHSPMVLKQLHGFITAACTLINYC